MIEDETVDTGKPDISHPSPTTKEATLEKINTAARLRVEGNSWKVIAPHIDRQTADSARRLVVDHPDEWKAAIAEARGEHLETIEAEARLTLRGMLRPVRRVYGKDGKAKHRTNGALETPSDPYEYTERDESITQRAAHSILHHAARERGLSIDATIKAGKDFGDVIRAALEVANESGDTDAVGFLADEWTDDAGEQPPAE